MKISGTWNRRNQCCQPDTSVSSLILKSEPFFWTKYFEAEEVPISRITHLQILY